MIKFESRIGLRFLLQQFYDLPNLPTLSNLSTNTFKTWYGIIINTYLQFNKYAVLHKNNVNYIKITPKFTLNKPQNYTKQSKVQKVQIGTKLKGKQSPNQIHKNVIIIF